MRGRPVYRDRARQDLNQIYEVIATDRPRAADQLVRRLVASCEALAQFPGMGRRRRVGGAEITTFVSNRFIIIYRVIEDPPAVEILRIIDGRRDLSSTEK